MDACNPEINPKHQVSGHYGNLNRQDRTRQVPLWIRQDPHVRLHLVMRQVPLPSTPWVSSSSPNVYHDFHYVVYDYFPRRPVNVYEMYHYRRPVNVYEMYHYRRPVNVYFPLRTRSARNARFEGITPRRCPWTECMLYEMPVFASCPFVTRFHATIPWEPGSREHPTILHDLFTPPFAPVSP